MNNENINDAFRRWTASPPITENFFINTLTAHMRINTRFRCEEALKCRDIDLNRRVRLLKPNDLFTSNLNIKPWVGTVQMAGYDPMRRLAPDKKVYPWPRYCQRVLEPSRMFIEAVLYTQSFITRSVQSDTVSIRNTVFTGRNKQSNRIFVPIRWSHINS